MRFDITRVLEISKKIGEKYARELSKVMQKENDAQEVIQISAKYNFYKDIKLNHDLLFYFLLIGCKERDFRSGVLMSYGE